MPPVGNSGTVSLSAQNKTSNAGKSPSVSPKIVKTMTMIAGLNNTDSPIVKKKMSNASKNISIIPANMMT